MLHFSLRELDARFIRHEVVIADKSMGRKLADGTMQWGGFESDCLARVEKLSEAQGLWFDCPQCFAKNGGSRGTHGVCVWFAGRGAPDRLGKNKEGRTVRWQVVSGSGLDSLVLSPSILLQGGCGWHGFVGLQAIPPGRAG